VYCEACVFRAERFHVPILSLEKWLTFMERNGLLEQVKQERNKVEEGMELHADMNDDVGHWVSRKAMKYLVFETPNSQVSFDNREFQNCPCQRILY
jgi:hypothetical protein